METKNNSDSEPEQIPKQETSIYNKTYVIDSEYLMPADLLSA